MITKNDLFKNKSLPRETFVFVLSPGVEPGALVPQTSILSIKLREQMKCSAYICGAHNTLKSEYFQYF